MKKLILLFTISITLISCGGPENVAEDSDGVGTLEHRIFISSSTVDGSISGTSGTGLERADALCLQLAKAAGLTRDYKAILGTSANTATSRIFIKGEIFTIAGSDKTKISGSSTDFWNADSTNLSNTIDRDQSGSFLNNAEAWTGSDTDGTSTDEDCNDWSDATASFDGDYGDNSKINGLWLASALALSCNNSKHLYCISQ